ncbi:MAG: phytoene desaturase family protein [Bdellovibrionales bacterium]
MKSLRGMGTPLSRLSLAKQYDNIIIGAGMGGLTCGAILALSGESVLILEGHYAVGGYTHVFRKGSFEFNAGLHYDGQAGYPGHPMNSIFNWISDGQVRWQSSTNMLERFYYGPAQEEYLVQSGLHSFVESLASRFPEEREAIQNYVQQVRKCENAMVPFFTEKMVPKWIGDLITPFTRPGFLKYARHTTHGFCSGLTQNEKLISVLGGPWHEFGVPPKVSSFAGHAMLRGNSIGGTFYPVGGTAGLALQIVPTIERCGGTVALSAKVKKITIKDGAACGVELENGTPIAAKRVISAVGVKGTFGRLVGEEYRAKLPFIDALMKLNSTGSASGVFLGLSASAEELGLAAYPVTSYPSYDYEESLREMRQSDLGAMKFPFIYMISQSARDPMWSQKHPGKSTLLVASHDRIDRYQKWADSTHANRPAEYLEYKEKMKEFFLEKAYALYPRIRGQVEIADAFTPLTVKQYGNHPSGEIYGLAQDPQRFEQRWLRPDTPIKNLYLSGVDVLASGVVAALLAGATTAINILGPWRGRHLLTKMMPWHFHARSPDYYK